MGGCRADRRRYIEGRSRAQRLDIAPEWVMRWVAGPEPLPWEQLELTLSEV